MSGSAVYLIYILSVILAPSSFFAGCWLLWAHIWIPQMRKYPGMLVMWQLISQLMIDLHWIISIPTIREENLFRNLTDDSCRIIGSMVVYFFFLSWSYILCLSIEIYIKIRSPYTTFYEKRMKIYHLLSHLLSFGIFLTCFLASNNNGVSLTGSCFVENGTWLELLMWIPVVLHTPILVFLSIKSILALWKKKHFRVLRAYVAVATTFTICWLPELFIHGLNYEEFGLEISVWFVLVSFIELGNTGGIFSGILVFISRCYNINLWSKLKYSLICKNYNTESFIKIEVKYDDYILNYENFFMYCVHEVRDKENIESMLLCLQKVLTDEGIYKSYTEDYCEYIFENENKYKVIDYHSKLFEKIRDEDGISSEEIRVSLSEYEEEKLFIETGGGHGGHIVFPTKNRRFYIKSIRLKELKLLRKIIVKIYEKTQQRRSFLSKIYGMFTIEAVGLKPTHIILMDNISKSFENPILFDIKGSSINRTVCDKSYELDFTPKNIVLKDIDFRNIVGSFELSQYQYLEIIEEIEQDVKLLEKSNIMDYSLIVAMDLSVNDEKHPHSEQYRLEVIKEDKTYIIYIGIIDFLQVYNTRKRLEKFFKSFVTKRKERSKISSIPAKAYKKRFLDNIRAIFHTETKSHIK